MHPHAAGFFITTEQIPAGLRWIQYICSLKYGMNLLVLNEFGEGTRDSWTAAQQAQAQYIIERNDIYPADWWVYLLILLLLVCVFRLLAIVALARRAATFF